MCVLKAPLQRPKNEPPIPLLRAPAKAAGAPAKIDDHEEEQPVGIGIRRHKPRSS